MNFVEIICSSPMNRIRENLEQEIKPYLRAVEALEEMRALFDKGYVLQGPDMLSVLKIIAKIDAALIPLRIKNDS